MRLSNPLQNKTSKAKSKIKAGGKKQQRPLWQRATAAVLVFVLLGTIGTFGYVKWKERDIKAQAAAYSLKYSNTRYAASYCKINHWTKRDKAIVRAILVKKFNGAPYAYIKKYNSNRSYQAIATQRAWFGTISVVSIEADRNGYVLASIGGERESSSKVSVNGLPTCAR